MLNTKYSLTKLKQMRKIEILMYVCAFLCIPYMIEQWTYDVFKSQFQTAMIFILIGIIFRFVRKLWNTAS